MAPEPLQILSLISGNSVIYLPNYLKKIFLLLKIKQNQENLKASWYDTIGNFYYPSFQAIKVHKQNLIYIRTFKSTINY